MYKPDHVLIDGEEYLVENHDPNLFTKPIDEVAMLLFKTKDIEFKGYWYVKDAPAYVWYQENPNRELGHKDYVVLKHKYNAMLEKQDMVIMGYDTEEMKQLSIKDAVLCYHCKTVCWSLSRHDYHACRCKDGQKQICVDGGSDYLKMSFGKNANYEVVSLDFINKMVNKPKKENSNEREAA